MLDLTSSRMEAAPFHEALARGPEGARANWLTASDGVRLRAAHWPAPGSRAGTVILFSGRTEYAEKYGPVARDLVGRGYDVLTVDWRGQGLSGRLGRDRGRGHVERFTDYQHDVAALMQHARAMGLPRPFHLLAHSMGGCIALRSLAQGLEVNSVAFSAPMWGIQLLPAVRGAAWTLSSASRQLGLGHLLAPGEKLLTYVLRADFAGNALTSDRETFEMMRAQVTAEPDLALGGPSLHWLNEALRETRRLAADKAPDVPALAFVGSDEAIVDPLRIKARLADWPGARLVTLAGARHEVLMEVPTIRQRVVDDVLEHFAAHS